MPLAAVLLGILMFSSSASPRALVTDEAAFRPFAEKVRILVDERLDSSAVPSGRELSTLLVIRVHLAIHFGDTATALATAARIRALQPTAEMKAFAGVTTEAFCAARADVTKDSPSRRLAFQREFARLLAALPLTPAMREVLVDQRQKTAALTADSIVRDVDQMVPPGSPEKEYSLANADEIIRARHKLADIVPLREAMLAEFDKAIAARTSP